MSDPSLQAGNLPSNVPGLSSRRSSSSAQKPLSTDDIHINLVMKMGFSLKSVELAIRTLSMFFVLCFLFFASFFFLQIIAIHLNLNFEIINYNLDFVGQQDVTPIVVGRIVEWIIEHPDECALANSHDIRLIENDSETESMSDAIETLSLNETNSTHERKFATRNDFESADQYATYVRSHVTRGMIVRCCEDFEEIQKGDIGTVEKVEPEALHDLNVYVDWRMYGTVYWMRFVHIELLEMASNANEVLNHHQSISTTADQAIIVVGSHVRIRSNVSTPRYKWGSVSSNSIGVVTAINRNGNVRVDFPQQFNWTGHISEMELVCQGNPDAIEYQNVSHESQSDGDLIEDWSRVIRSLSV